MGKLFDPCADQAAPFPPGICVNCWDEPIADKAQYREWKFCEGCGQQVERELAEQARLTPPEPFPVPTVCPHGLSYEADGFVDCPACITAELIAESLWERRPLYKD